MRIMSKRFVRTSHIQAVRPESHIQWILSKVSAWCSHSHATAQNPKYQHHLSISTSFSSRKERSAMRNSLQWRRCQLHNNDNFVSVSRHIIRYLTRNLHLSLCAAMKHPNERYSMIRAWATQIRTLIRGSNAVRPKAAERHAFKWRQNRWEVQAVQSQRLRRMPIPTIVPAAAVPYRWVKLKPKRQCHFCWFLWIYLIFELD